MDTASSLEFRPFAPSAQPPAAGDLGMTPVQMAQTLWLIEHVGTERDLDRVLEELFQRVRDIIPCNRLGLALVETTDGLVRSRWVQSDHPVKLGPGFVGPLRGSTLQLILDRREARIISDLRRYLDDHPASVSTLLIVEEGMRASLTCPLIVRDVPIGFLFFTSTQPGAYEDANLRFYQHIAAQLSLVIERARLYSDLSAYARTIEQQNRQINQDLDLARQLQETFIPAAAPAIPGFDIAMHYQPLLQVGGDLLELTPLPDGGLLIFIADAMGHGVHAALVMSILKGMLSSVIASASRPEQLMDRLNRALHPLVQDYFVVAACIRIDPTRNVGQMVRAGLPPPLLLKGATGEARPLTQGGMPLTVDAEETYQPDEFEFIPGDLLLLATDGLIEATNADDLPFGDQRVAAVLLNAPDLPARDLVSRVLAEQQAFCQSHQQQDDMTILAVRRTR